MFLTVVRSYVVGHIADEQSRNYIQLKKDLFIQLSQKLRFSLSFKQINIVFIFFALFC